MHVAQVLWSIAAEAVYYQAPESNFCNSEADFHPPPYPLPDVPLWSMSWSCRQYTAC